MKRFLSGIYTLWYFFWNVLVPVTLVVTLSFGAIYFLVNTNICAAGGLVLILVLVNLAMDIFSPKNKLEVINDVESPKEEK